MQKEKLKDWRRRQMKKINFEEGVLVAPAKVNEDGTITSAKRTGTTPLSPHVLNLMQENIENAINENTGLEVYKYTLAITADTEKRSRDRNTLFVSSGQ